MARIVDFDRRAQESRLPTQDRWTDVYLINGSAKQLRAVETAGNFEAIHGFVAIDEAGDKAFNSGGLGPRRQGGEPERGGGGEGRGAPSGPGWRAGRLSPPSARYL